MDDFTPPVKMPQENQQNDSPPPKRKLLSDILAAGNGTARLREKWNEVTAADDYGAALPAGSYVCRLVAGDLANSRTNNTPGYKLTFEVVEGDHAGRRVWHDIWLTEAALPMAKRDLSKLGITALDQLELPLPRGIVCTLKLARRKNDDGLEYNSIKTFEVLRIEAPESDPFAPADAEPAEGGAS